MGNVVTDIINHTLTREPTPETVKNAQTVILGEEKPSTESIESTETLIEASSSNTEQVE